MRAAYIRLKAGAGAFTAYQCQVKRAALVPEAGDETTYRTLCATGTWSEVANPTWTLELEGAQGWGASDGLARFLFDNRNAVISWQLDQYGEGHVPTAEEPGFSGTARAIPAEYGGEVDTYAEFTVALPVIGEPVLVVATFPSLDEDAPEGDAVEQAA
jgi:hypothetical protein